MKTNYFQHEPFPTEFYTSQTNKKKNQNKRKTNVFSFFSFRCVCWNACKVCCAKNAQSLHRFEVCGTCKIENFVEKLENNNCNFGRMKRKL